MARAGSPTTTSVAAGCWASTRPLVSRLRQQRHDGVSRCASDMLGHGFGATRRWPAGRVSFSIGRRPADDACTPMTAATASRQLLSRRRVAVLGREEEHGGRAVLGDGERTRRSRRPVGWRAAHGHVRWGTCRRCERTPDCLPYLDGTAELDARRPTLPAPRHRRGRGIDVHPLSGNGWRQRRKPLALPHALTPWLRRRPRHEVQLADHLAARRSRPRPCAGCPGSRARLAECRARRCRRPCRRRNPGVEPALQLGDIVAADHRHPVVEHAVAKREAWRRRGYATCRGQRCRRRGDRGPLETSATAWRVASPKTPLRSSVGAPERREPVLDVPDRLSFVTESIEPHGSIVSHVRRIRRGELPRAPGCSQLRDFRAGTHEALLLDAVPGR